jgi:hypothetical protein
MKKHNCDDCTKGMKRGQRGEEWLRGRRLSPARRHRTLIEDHLTMCRPHQTNGVRRADTRRAWITCGTEPVVLRCTSGTPTNASVGGTVHGVAENLVHELRIVRDDRRRQVMAHSFTGLNQQVGLVVLVFGDNLELSTKKKRKKKNKKKPTNK